MALTQMQIIQSLGEAMAWFERERQWDVPPTELRHLCGRIGELYVALITNGQMALAVNQRGYDVVSALGERISVKTTAMMGNNGHVSFNPKSMGQVDRVIVLRINTDEMQVEVLLDAPIAEAISLMTAEGEGKRTISLSRLVKKSKPRSEIKTTNIIQFQGYTISELESGTIEIEHNGRIISPAKPILKELALQLNISLLNSNGNPLNTRQLGSLIIKNVTELQRTET
ncbi:MAG: hypothetical protein NVS3B3_06170 [Aquirhabdus sp.]